MIYKDLEYVPGDNLIKEFIPVDKSEHARWMSTWSNSSYSLDNVFTDEELIWLEDLMHREHKTRRIKKNGTLHFNVDNKRIQDKFFDKLKMIIPELENETLWEGNFLITSTPYNLHIDTGNPNTLKDSGMIPGKQFIIPLWICHSNKETDEPLCGTAIFKNRFLMYGTNFAKGNPQYETNVFYTISDYRELPCYHADGTPWNIDWNKQTIRDEDYQKYFTHFNKKWLEGFELESVYNWKRGGIIVFDRCQAHSGINFSKNNVTMKCGLSMMTTIKK
jgi:hypothetical protein